MKCNKKNCPLVGNNENCDIKDCKWRTEDVTCKDAISREYALGVIYPSNIYPSRADIYKALKDAPSVTAESKAESIIEACVLETATREAYEEGMADAWKIAQTVFASEVTLYEAMDVAKCMKGADE